MKRILVVDDFRANVIMVQQALYSKYEIDTATSGKEALQRIKVATPDLLILDIQMPEMSGIELLKLMKADPSMKEIPVVFLTGKADRESVTKGFKLGIKDIISKPIIMKTVEARISRVFDLMESAKTEVFCVMGESCDSTKNEISDAFDQLLDENFWLDDDWKDLI
ncbi:MAG: PleD family two-component system response regulator [Velocimicrobium sp.]